MKQYIYIDIQFSQVKLSDEELSWSMKKYESFSEGKLYTYK